MSDAGPHRLHSHMTPAQRPAKRAARLADRVRARRFRINPLSAAVVVLALVVWALVSNFVLVDSLALPSPQVLGRTFWDLFQNGYGHRSIFEHIGTSMGRALTGFLLAVVCSTVIGLLVGYSATARAILMPFIDFIRPVPALALVPLFVFFFGIGSLSKVALIFLGAFVYMTLQTSDGVRSIPADLFSAGRSMGFTTAQMFRHVVLPGTLPAVVTGMRTALSLSWALVVAAELIAAPSGLGYIVTDATQFFQIPVVYCAVILLGVLGFAMDRLIVAFRARVLHWQGK
ncbi:ABC transporter permease [Variovorax sp. PBL-E5]|uniref:ABC transporter permease n=1 Tax=Variovorax sp. PBL-E5 TaxID=434014 RepID=UPI001316EAA2|nr:ABC transporter permease [Variovorax sp. PBL-E5]VTU30215.1 Putative aliphatic sulfonates transport permease protein SsuC [Variovorax sp. PBL-E5]